MTDPERRRRVEDVCDAALDRDARERAAFVAAACGRRRSAATGGGGAAGARADGGGVSRSADGRSGGARPG